MHLIKGGWVGAGQTFAIATSNDSDGRKSRIRRSKEERKSMAESFIKKYQESNNGSFPSLNLTHKEVGGSFYTVREIVRDIIQENRVLAPPKASLEEHDHYGCLEQHPLGSISMEPQMDMSVSDRIRIVTHKVPSQYGIASEEHISSSCMQILGPEPLELNSINGLDTVTTKDKKNDRASYPVTNHHQNTSTEKIPDVSGLLPQPSCHEENKNIDNDGKALEENPVSDKPVITYAVDIHHPDNSNLSASLPNHHVDGPESHMLSNEQNVSKNNQIVEKTKEFGQRIYTESVVMEILDREKDGAKDIDVSQVVTSHTNSNVVVKTFLLRSVSGTIHMHEEFGNGTIHMHEEFGKLNEATGTFEDKTVQQDKLAIAKSISGSVSENDDMKLSELNLKFHGEFRDEKVALNLEVQSLENSKFSTTSKSTVLDEGDLKDSESKGSFTSEAKASCGTEKLMTENSAAVERNSSDHDKSTLPKGSNPMLDRINLETWEGESKKSTHTESNPFLALFRAFVSAFVKFWSD